MMRGQRTHWQRPKISLLLHSTVAKHATPEEIVQSRRSHLHEQRGLSGHSLLDASCSHAPRSAPREQIDMQPLNNGLLKQLREFEFHFESTKHPPPGIKRSHRAVGWYFASSQPASLFSPITANLLLL